MTTTIGERHVPPDAVLDAVADARRRAVLRALSDADGGTLPLETLVDRVAERLAADGGGFEPDHRDRVAIQLHHAHLPKLADCGMVAIDHDRNEVRNTTGDLGRELLDVLEPHESHG